MKKNLVFLFLIWLLSGCAERNQGAVEFYDVSLKNLKADEFYNFNLSKLDFPALYEASSCKSKMEKSCSTEIEVIEYETARDKSTILPQLLRRFTERPRNGLIMYCGNEDDKQVLFSYFTFVSYGDFGNFMDTYGFCRENDP